MVGHKNDSSSKIRDESLSSVSIIEVKKLNINKNVLLNYYFLSKKSRKILMSIDIKYCFKNQIFDRLSFIVFTK